jgi:hypothetical protein
MSDYLEVVRFFDPIGDGLRSVKCPDCRGEVFVFMEPASLPFAVNQDGTLHVFTCGLLSLDVYRQVMKMRVDETAYDTALLIANAKFCPPFL